MKTLALIICCSISLTALAEKWKMERDRDGIKVYTRRVEGIAFKQYKGEITIDAPLSTLVTIFNDLEAGPDWVDQCSKMELVEQISPSENITYVYTPAPWPVKDRDAVVQTKISQDPQTLVVTIKQTAVPDKKEPNKKAVRVKRVDGTWTLTPTKDGKTALVYQVLSDPGGGLPAWLVNAVAISQPFNTLDGMRKMAGKDEYRNVKVDYITDP